MSDSSASPADRVIKCRHAKNPARPVRATSVPIILLFFFFLFASLSLHQCLFYSHVLFCFESIPVVLSCHLFFSYNKRSPFCWRVTMHVPLNLLGEGGGDGDGGEEGVGGWLVGWLVGEGGYPVRYAIIRVFPRYSIRIHPLTEALPHFLPGGMSLPLCIAKAIVRHPVCCMSSIYAHPLLAVVSCY